MAIAVGADGAAQGWAFKTPDDPPVPKLRKGAPGAPIDLFLRAARESDREHRGIQPAREADKRTLIRRATFDLTGLPPTPEEINAFLGDKSSNAFARVVDRLLGSPQYGQKWARHWLDVVRYTDSFDSRGTGGEGDCSEAWRYRDWVVEAFNQDLPYDQFIIQQMAGDILATNRPGYFDTNALIATTVYAIGEWGGGDADKEKMLTDIVDDQIDLTGRGFLGLTLACARCHDHKFDPIPTADYYGLAGIFFSSHIMPGPGAKTAGSPVSRLPLIEPGELVRRRAAELRAGTLEKKLDALSGGGRLTRLRRGQFNLPALSELHPETADLPSVVANAAAEVARFLTISLPGRSVAIHPGPDKNVAAIWSSPVDDEVAVSGSLADADDKCGNGIEWKLFQGEKVLQSGVLDNGGRTNLGALRVSVRAGETIQLAVLPRGTDYACDTTVVSLEIKTQKVGAKTWRLPEDLVDDLAAGAREGVWSFVAYKTEPPRLAPVSRSEAEQKEIEAMRTELMRLRGEIQGVVPVGHGWQEGGTPGTIYAGVHDTKILMRGRYDRPAGTVPRHFPQIISAGESVAMPESGSGRLELARWIANPKNPMTARVMVNRIWQQHFGEGIVRTPNNFGKLGRTPTHPELLDWLAHRFVESGWSVKSMHRLMMNSAAYQQESRVERGAAQRDPENLLFGRMNRRRLEAEEIRDSLLAVAGRLDARAGGPAVNDLSTPRRTLYLMTIRSDKSNYRTLFDAPDAQTMAEGRLNSTVAPQALFLMNSPFVLEQAKALAERCLGWGDRTETGRVRALYELLYGREPAEVEIKLGLRAIAVDGDRSKIWAGYVQALLCANEFIYID